MKAAIGALRRGPYRLFFPLGAAIGAVGVGYWLAFVTGWVDSYHGYGHALVQVEGFLLAFAIGFLGTMIPRRMQAAPPGALGLALVAVALVVATFGSLTDRRVLSQSATLLVLLWLAGFVLRRIAGRAGDGGDRRRPPDAFVLLPIAFVMALASVTLLLLGELGVVHARGLGIGRAMLQEGVFLCLVLGIGRFLLPVILGGAVPPDMTATPASRRARQLFAAAGVLLAASFVAQPFVLRALGEVASTRLVYAFRCALVLAALLPTRPWRPPAKTGSQRTLAWIAAWMVPLGLALAACFPAWRIGMLHVTYAGGFGLLSLAVGAHVILAHGGWEQRVLETSWWMRTFGALVLLSVTARVTAEIWPRSWPIHVGGAAGIWLLGIAVWLAFLLRPAWGPRADAPEHADPS